MYVHLNFLVSVLIVIPKREGETSLLEERFNILKHNDKYEAYVSLVKRMGYQCHYEKIKAMINSLSLQQRKFKSIVA